MKQILKRAVCYTSMGLLAGSALAQTTYNQPSSSGSSGNESTLNQSSASQSTVGQVQEYFQAKKFIGTEAKDSAGQNVGEIKDLVFSPQNGEIFAAFNASNGRYYLVPWQALSITTGNKGKVEQVTLNATKQDLESGPTIPRNQWQQLSSPTFVQSIYSHYNLQMPSAMGGAGSRSLGGSSSGSDTSGWSHEKGSK